MKKHFSHIFLIIIVPLLVFNYLHNKYAISILHYGVKANEIRYRLHIPVIDKYMNAINEYNAFFGNRWEASHELPKDTMPLHAWKNVTPLTDSVGLDYEVDAYRKRYNDSLCLQMNIYSRIHGDTMATRVGKLFFYNSDKPLSINLSDFQIDSVSQKWGLNYLIREK